MTAATPAVRLRRLRKSSAMRALFKETTLTPGRLVQPYFIVPGERVKKEAKPGLGLWQVSADMLVDEARPLVKGGVGGLMLFGVPDRKDDSGAALSEQLEPLLRAVDRIKSAEPDVPIFADVCLCSYTTHGHCGLVKDGRIENDASVAVLAKMALAQAKAGVDFVSPSDMMDGRVAAIRRTLDEAGAFDTGVLSYAVKMASAFYGPFRAAADSAPSFGDRTTYQMPATNRREALRELALDEAEGADALLVKPALTNLDLIRDARERSDLPLFAYQVSGEYAMLRAAAEKGLMDFDRAMLETLSSIQRAGADVIVSYYARDWLLK
ncbi:MAG: porphobilinogen synthase [Deltaproteobacteria bacterium]|nr:porphobilinogen synthase [Deltaproteobacteria bacterium]